MKNAKWLSLLAAVLAAGILTGCGAASSTASSAAASSVASAPASSATSSAAESAPAADAAITVGFTVTDQDGNATEYPLEATVGETLSEALASAKLISDDEAAAGFVTTVNGVTANYDTDKAWWMLVDKDGNMTDVGIGDITLADGDSYGFVYTVG